MEPQLIGGTSLCSGSRVRNAELAVNGLKEFRRQKLLSSTTRSWKDDKGEWKDKTQWHTIVAYGQGFAQLTPRLSKGAHVFVQGELTTREYDRPIQVPNGKKSIDHVIQQLAVELKADTIRLLGRSTSSEQLSADESNDRDEVPR